MPDVVFNPLNAYPRNMACWCGSGKKAKKCHLPRVARLVPVTDAPKLAEFCIAAQKYHEARRTAA